MNIFSRRSFLQNTTKAGIAAVSIPDIIQTAYPDRKKSKIEIKPGATVLFQGDSITDAGRDQHSKDFTSANADRTRSYNDFNVMGSGYAMLSSSRLLFDHPMAKLKILNRGISGNKVFQLAARWQEDCLDLKPDVLSILIGVNDYWHTLAGGTTANAKSYRANYINLMDQTKQALPDVQLIVGEPFAIRGVDVVTDKWFPAFDEYKAAAKEIADTYHALFIPYQQIFDEAIKRVPASYWTFDGVHPSVPGAMLMAQAWLETVSVK